MSRVGAGRAGAARAGRAVASSVAARPSVSRLVVAIDIPWIRIFRLPHRRAARSKR
jgi:hypothetical protein